MRKLLRVAVAALLLTACGDDPEGVKLEGGSEVGVVVSSTDRLLTIFPADTPQSVTQIGLAPDGSPVSLAVRRNVAVIPLGTLPAVVVVDLSQGRLRSTIALPANSGATGAAFINDSIALIANPGRNTVSPVNVLRGTAGPEIGVGTYPQAIVASGDTAFVLNAELGPDFRPRRNGTVTVIAGSALRVVGTIELSATNPINGALGPNNILYVLNAGSFSAANGSLSTVDRGTARETRNDAGFGEFPGAIAVTPDGRVYVGAFDYGVAV